jgi:glyoxylase-like metal-dependent hydrolase (beta-lactamase superfamily II)
MKFESKEPTHRTFASLCDFLECLVDMYHIHRGTSQIGGCVTEIRSGSGRIIIDFSSSNLQGAPRHEFLDTEILDMEYVNAVLCTHYHGDHVGLLSKVADGVGQYIGEGDPGGTSI